MDRPWQHHPHHPVSGNLCPICSTPHFPFCPPHPNPRPQFGPNFVPNFAHQMGMNRAPYPQMGDPYWGGQRPHMVDDYGNVGMENGYVGSDRSRKRMRVEFSENDRRLRLIHDHGGSFGGQYYDGVDSSHLGMYGEHRGRVEHQPGFVPRYGEDHVRYVDRGDPSQVEALGRVGGPQREGLDGYFSNSQRYEHTIGGNSSEFENRNGFHHGSNVAMGNDTFVSEKTPTNPVQHHGYGYQSSHHYDVMREVEVVPGHHHGAAVRPTIPIENQHGHSATMKQGAYGPQQAWQGFEALPSLPSSPAPHIPMDPVGHWPRGFKNPSSSPQTPSSVFPTRGSSLGPSHSLRPCGPQVHPSAQPYFSNSQPMHGSENFIEGSNIQTSAGEYFGEHSSPEDKLSDKPQILDASHLFKPPNRVSRPDHFVIILRGLPGSGKGYLAKMLRDLEVEHSGNAPRIHSMDDYFMTEVEKVEENSAPKTSARGRKPATKRVLEYCYEPEMLEAYRSSMLKAFKKTLEEGAFTFVIVDDRNLRVADFAQFWATAKRSGYEVYVLEAPYKDPAGCAARNVHGFSTEEVEKMAAEWEETPPLYLRLDVKSLFHGDNLKGNDIEEVDMDMEDSGDESMSKLEEKKPENTLASKEDNANQDGSPREEQKWTAENSESEVKDLGHSKWLGDLDDVDAERIELRKGKSNARSGLLQTYSKEGKSVHWGDKALNSGFSIGTLKKANMASLVIGRGAGYNLKSNPLLEEDAPPSSQKSADLRQHHMFEERLRAERQSFKAVFDRRRQRIGGFDGNADDE